MGDRAAMLISLPHGQNVSGVAMWGLRLAGALVERGRPAGLVLHSEPAGCARIDAQIDPRVRVWRAPGPPLDACRGDLSPLIPVYRDAARELAERCGGRVIVSPNLHGESYGIAVALSLVEPEMIRVIGWQHSDIEYDRRVLEHYEPAISGFVGVSGAIAAALRQRLHGRAGDVQEIPYGVPLGPAVVHRRTGELKLLYAGRLEHHQKRVMALAALSRALSEREVRHRLTIAGDGPARSDLERGATTEMEFAGAITPEAVRALCETHDAFVLPSRFEGLSVAILEAMAAGCIPILARTRSGADQAVEDGVSGAIVDVSPDDDEAAVGSAMAMRLRALFGGDPGQSPDGLLDRMSFAARERAAAQFSLRAHADRVLALLDRVAASPPRPWPAARACAFSGGQSGAPGGSIPSDAPRRLARVLESLAGRMIAIHGAGSHTIALAAVLAASPARIVGITDDDRGRQGGGLLGWPIVAPQSAASLGATDIVISSWMHEGAIWERRGAYEAQGLRVHRLYPGPQGGGSCCPTAS
jgi:glycosyltransferase involved in cell wall biosynthesis